MRALAWDPEVARREPAMLDEVFTDARRLAQI